MPKDITCRHFNGIQHDTCKIGVTYEDVIDLKATGLTRLPCLGQGKTGRCKAYAQWKEEELAQQKSDIESRLNHFDDFHHRRREDCPRCGKHVVRLYEVGRCTYANPCRCRVHQGRIPQAWK